MLKTEWFNPNSKVKQESCWWYTYPSEKYESQLAWWNSQLNGNIQKCSKPPEKPVVRCCNWWNSAMWMYLRRDPSQRLQDHNFHIASKGLKQGGLPNFLNPKFGWFLGMLAHLGVSNSPYPKSLPRSCNKATHAWKCGEKRLFRNTTRCSEVLRAEPKITAGIVDDLETTRFLTGQDVDLWLIPFPYEKNTWEPMV